MKRIIIFSFILISSLSFTQNLNIMTYNIRLSLESDKENSWENRKEDALALMSYYHPDIMGVQEAVPQQMKDIQNSLKDYGFVGVGRDDGKDKGEYSAIFYDKNKLEVLQSGTFWLSETPDVPSRGWDAAYNRICTYALFKTKKGGKKFWSFNLHFDHIGNVARVNSAKLILEKMKELNPKNLPVTLTGDFNLTDTTKPIQIISKSMTDSYYHSEKPHYGPKGSFQAFDINTPAKERIDYVFVKGFKVISNRTINDRRENLLYPSDHFPVLAELKFE